jgi:GNAT superfamily N-acetyltransferase
MLPSLYRVAKRTLNRLPSWLLRARPFGVYEIVLTPPAAQAVKLAGSPPLACVVRWVDSADDLQSLVGLTSQANVDAFDANRRRVAAAYYDGRPIGCAWIAREWFDEPELGLRIELGANEAWLFAAAVTSALRNRGVYGQLLEFLMRDQRENAMERILLGVASGNVASRLAHERQGARRVGSIAAVRALGVACCWVSGSVRRASRSPLGWRHPIRLVVDE